MTAGKYSKELEKAAKDAGFPSAEAYVLFEEAKSRRKENPSPIRKPQAAKPAPKASPKSYLDRINDALTGKRN
jgi:hypothetical protein